MNVELYYLINIAKKTMKNIEMLFFFKKKTGDYNHTLVKQFHFNFKFFLKIMFEYV